MVLKHPRRRAMHFSIEMSEEAYETLRSNSEVWKRIEDFVTQLNAQIDEEIADRLADVVPTRDINAELRLVQSEEEIDLEEEFRQAWADVKEGRTLPASVLYDDAFWKSLDAKSDPSSS